MKYAILREWENFTIEEKEKPVPQPGEALIRVKYTGVCGGDAHMFQSLHPRARLPVTPGHEFCGYVERINGESDGFQVGDLVTVHPLYSCKTCENCLQGRENVCRSIQVFGVDIEGSLKEYITAPIGKTYKFKEDATPEIAALVEPLAVAVHDARRSRIMGGVSVLVVGGGTIGILIALVARQYGAGKVMISEINDYRLKLAESFGFEAVNPMHESAKDILLNGSGGLGFDRTFEVTGVAAGVDTCTSLTKPGGTIVLVGIPKEKIPFNIVDCVMWEYNVKGVRIHSQFSFGKAVDLINSHSMDQELSRLVTSIYPLDKVNEAFWTAIRDKAQVKVLIDLE